MTTAITTASSGASETSDILIWGAILIALMLAGAVVIYAARKMTLDRQSSSQDGFTLYDLRKMRDSGQISEDEFQAARQQMIDRVRKSTNRQAGVDAKKPDDDKLSSIRPGDPRSSAPGNREENPTDGDEFPEPDEPQERN